MQHKAEEDRKRISRNVVINVWINSFFLNYFESVKMLFTRENITIYTSIRLEVSSAEMSLQQK